MTTTSHGPLLLMKIALILLVHYPSESKPDAEFQSHQFPRGPSTGTSYPYAHLSRQLETVVNPTLQRDLQLQLESVGNRNSTVRCSICGTSVLLTEDTPYFFNVTDGSVSNWTCGTWQYVAGNMPDLCPGIASIMYGQCCQHDEMLPVYKCEQNIREAILQDYDTAVPPIVSHKQPLLVTVQLIYQMVQNVNVQQGTSDIYVTILQTWNDPRLAWNQTPATCTNQVTVYMAHMDPQNTEIWVPDFDLYNQIQGIASMPNTMAMVYSDGTVTVTRFGRLGVMCQFTGLAQIPFDVLGCQLKMGAFVRFDQHQIQFRLPEEGGIVDGGHRQIYSEYLPLPHLFQSGRVSPNDPMLYFNVYFRRAQNYYVFNLIVPTVILTYVSLGTFLLDLRVGERLSYGMALALVVVAQQISTAGMIPVSNERLWIDKFIAWSFYWVIVGLLESVFVGYIFFLREDHFCKESDDEKRSKIYDGVRESVLIGHAKNNGNSSSSSNSEDSSNEMQPPTQQSVDSYHPTSNSKWGPSCSTDDLEEALNRERNTAAEIGSRNKAVTLKMELKQSANQPLANRKQEFTRTMTNREVHTQESASEKVKTLRWKWMYTFSLRKLDRFFFFFTLVTYTLFLIAMFASREMWGKNVRVVWDGSTDE